jgi:hypothetical protein
VRRIDPQIKGSHDKQDEWDWKYLHGHHNPLEKFRCRQVEFANEREENCPRKVTGRYDPGGRDQERKPPDAASFGPEHGAGGNREQKKPGVNLAVVDRQHG